VSAFDRLRPPASDDPTAPAYKDWYHLNFFDHRTGRIGLINTSLHGAPGDARSRAIGTALVHDPQAGWIGNVAVEAAGDAEISENGIALDQLTMRIGATADRLCTSAAFGADGFTAEIEALPASRPYCIDAEPPFGSGWLGWSVVPRLRLSGRYTLRDEENDLAGVSGYHDHNWGRWHWGDDVGWEWGAFMTEAPGPVFVASRMTDKAHHRCEPPQLLAVVGPLRRRFEAGTVSAMTSGLFEDRLRRLPGALAALHQDWLHPRLPARLRLEAVAGLDWITMDFTAIAAAQLVASDPARGGYAFIHELVGRFTAAGRVRGLDVTADGLGVFEHVQ
jgi:hypothetical protein